MRTLVKKWGNSASVRIPAAILKSSNLHLDEPVDVREESGRIIIEPLHPNCYDLVDLVSKITDENLHDEIDYGKRVGKEAW